MESPKQDFDSGDSISYKSNPGSPGSGSGSNPESGDDQDQSYDLLNPENVITDSQYWDSTMNPEGEKKKKKKLSEEEKNYTASVPTGKLTKISMAEHDYTIGQNSPPIVYKDWQNFQLRLPFSKLKKCVFGHGWEIGTSSDSDLVDCPLQLDPSKYQRENCSKITAENVKKLGDKIQNVTTSTDKKMAKIKMAMPYFDSQKTIGYLDTEKGDCFFFHENGEFWSYKKYETDELPMLISDAIADNRITWASDYSSNLTTKPNAESKSDEF